MFRQAGLPGPAVIEHIAAGGGPAMRPYCDNSAGIVRSLLPRIEQFGIATAADVDVETLADRLEQAMCAGRVSAHLHSAGRGVDNQRRSVGLEFPAERATWQKKRGRESFSGR